MTGSAKSSLSLARRILELGSGTGAAGLAFAASGAQAQMHRSLGWTVWWESPLVSSESNLRIKNQRHKSIVPKMAKASRHQSQLMPKMQPLSIP